MKYFADTSALLKRYIHEPGSDQLALLYSKAQTIIVSAITKSEAYSALNFRRLLGDISKSQYQNICNHLEADFDDFEVIPFDITLESKIKVLAEKYGHKTMDNIQLASCLTCKPDYFLLSDKKLAKLAEQEKIKVKII